MNDKIRIVVIDDHPMMREGVIHILASENDFQVVGEGSSADDALRVARESRPDIMLLDLSMPGGGIDAVRAISVAYPFVKLVILTVSEQEKYVQDSFLAGASGYILKGISGGDFVRSVRAIHHGESYVSPGLAARLLGDVKTRKPQDNPPEMEDLTQREREILSLLCKGLSNKEIGERLALTEKTIKHYMTIIFQKLHVRNRLEAALLARSECRET